MGNPLNGVIFGTILVIVGLSTYVTGNGRDDPAWTITITFFVPAVNDGTTVLISVVEIMVLAKLTGTPSHVICNILLKFDPLIVIVDPFNGTILGTILLIVGVATYVIFDVFDSTPIEFTCNGYTPIVDAGAVAIIVVSVNDVIAMIDDPIVNDNGFCSVS